MQSTDLPSIHNPIEGTRITFAETSAQTGNERTVLQVELDPGGRVLSHTHGGHAERFEVFEGVLSVNLAGTSHELRSGDTFDVPLGTSHSFSNNSDSPVRFQATTTPGHQGFENQLRVAFGLVNDGLTTAAGVPRSIDAIALLLMWGESPLPGPFVVLGPFFRWRASRAKGRGLDRELLARYGGQVNDA